MSNLILKKMRLENFKGFTGEHMINLDQAPGLYFVQGKNLLNPELGANGVGKSTLFDALLWVLFNKTGRDARPAAAISPWGKKGTTSVQLWFERNGEDHFIYRTRSPNSLRHSVGASDDDKEIEQEDIPAILGMSEEMLRRTIVLGQFGTLFLDLRAEQQAQMFTEALSLDIWLRAVDAAGKASKLSSAALRDIETKEASNNALLQSTDERITQHKREADGFEDNRKEELEDVEERIEEQEKVVTKLRDDPIKKPEQPSRKALADLEKEIAPIRDKRANLNAEYQALLRDVQKAEDDLEAFDAGQDKDKAPRCPECGQVISKREAEDHRKKISDKIDDFDKKVKDKKKELDDCDAKGKGIKDKITAAQADYDKEIRSFDRKTSDWDKYNRDFNREVAALTALKVERDGISKAANVHKQLHADAIAKRADYRQRKTDLEKNRKLEEGKKADADFWIEAFREIRLGIIDSTLIELEMAASRHMAMLGLDDWGIKFTTERETKGGSVSMSFTVLLYPTDRDEPVKWESYSGGESQRIQLAVAFALSEVLLARAGLSPNIEVLDEPTRGLSPSGIDDLIEHLRDRALELGRAIYLIEHHSLDKGSFDGIITIEKDKKGSRIIM